MVGLGKSRLGGIRFDLRPDFRCFPLLSYRLQEIGEELKSAHVLGLQASDEAVGLFGLSLSSLHCQTISKVQVGPIVGVICFETSAKMMLGSN
jgi:hypothetical protein